MNLFFQQFGSGFPLIILHGLFGSSDNWQGLGKRLGHHFTVYAIDLRNHGNSPHAEKFSLPTMAEDLREFFLTHNLTQAHLLGHSMGGKVAMQFAQMFPALVKNLVVVDIAPKTYHRSHDDIFSALLGTDPSHFTTRIDVDKALASKIPDTATRQFLLKNLAPRADGTLKWKINLSSIYAHYDEILAELTVTGIFRNPTLFLRGGKSDYIQNDDVAAIRQRFPLAQLATIHSAGHWVHAEAPNEFLQAVLSFLNN